jgi:PAS domain S-box-containing protein
MDGIEQVVSRLACQYSPVIYYLADRESARPFEWISPNVETITGHEARAVVGDGSFFLRQIHPDDSFDSGQTTNEFRVRTADDAYVWLRDESRVIPDSEPGGGKIFGCLTDISTEKLAEQKLADLDRERSRLSMLLSDAVDGSPHGLTVRDPDGKLVFCNRAFSDLYELETEALLGKTRKELGRMFIRRIRQYDDILITDPDADLDSWLERLGNIVDDPIELELNDGRWMLVTGHHTADGGFALTRTDITKQKRTELALRESEQRFRYLLESHPLPVCMIELDSGKILYESPAMKEMFGDRELPDNERTAHDYYADPTERASYVDALRAGGGVENFDLHLKRVDGTGFWVSVTSKILNVGGRECSLSGLIDLTERRRREEELQRTRETLEDAIESLSEGFALFDSEDKLIICNTPYRDFHKVSADIMKPGMIWADLIQSDLDNGLYVEAIGREAEWLRERKEMRRNLQTNLEYKQSDGRWVSGSNRPTRQGGIVVTLADITDRKEAEQALLESEGLVRRVLESCPVPLAMNRLDDGEYIYISPANAELLGIDPADGPVFSPDSYADPKVREDYVNRLREEKRIVDLEVQRVGADGTPFWVSMSSQLIDYKGEEMIVSSILDLTERHAVEEEMARQRQALHQSEKLSALGSLLASVAHELNNPLSIVVAQSMLLEEVATDPDISKRASKISTAADRCARIVKTFLAMARQEPSEYQAVDLNEVMKSALDVTGYALRTSGIEVSARLASDAPSIQGDADQLTQVVTNLILNAQQAMEGMDGEGRLKIRTSYRPSTGELVIKIKDNGPGIGTDVRSRIFEPFFTTKRMEAGTGIGLAICHRIIESHGGTIAVEDTRDPGACFVIRFPESTRSGEGLQPAERQEDSRSPLSILVVDDDADVLDILADILRSDGHQVEAAESGDAALDRLRERDFDAVVSDLRMPGLDGRGLYENLEQELPAVAKKLMFLTGDTMSAEAKSFLDGSGRPYLEKPINPRELRVLVRRVAEQGAS